MDRPEKLGILVTERTIRRMRTYVYDSPYDAVEPIVDSIKVVQRAGAGVRKQQQRSAVTRQALISSARVIFARDGFEQARLEDIAADAGRTRGAFYDHFKDKEDLFCAIFEENIDRDAAELIPLLTGLLTAEERLEAVAQYLSLLCKDRERTLLNLEFKLYAVRHSLNRKRLADLHRYMCLRCAIPAMDKLFPGPVERTPEVQLTESLVLGGMVDGLALNHLFNPEMLNDVELARYLKRCVRDTLPSL